MANAIVRSIYRHVLTAGQLPPSGIIPQLRFSFISYMFLLNYKPYILQTIIIICVKIDRTYLLTLIHKKKKKKKKKKFDSLHFFHETREAILSISTWTPLPEWFVLFFLSHFSSKYWYSKECMGCQHNRIINEK